MNAGVNFRREHFRTTSRTHYVITEGGDQPNIVPDHASVWYFIREVTPEGIRENFEIINRIAEGAALMTETKVSRRVIGSAYPQHGNKVLAEMAYENMKRVGMPDWSEADQAYARRVQEAVGSQPIGLRTEIGNLGLPVTNPTGGGSDDIGDVMWTVPTITIRYSANIAGTTGHHWTAALASATPIAHKGAAQMAKVMAMTALELFLDETLLEAAWEYFHNVQTKDGGYESFLSETDQPAIDINQTIMAKVRPLQEKYYYNPAEFETYLDQLGIEY